MSVDEWDNCYDGRLTKAEFAETFCSRCIQPACERSTVNRSAWMQRMSTQVDRLLENPRFADLKDPRWADLRRHDFPSAARQAVTAELVNRRGDWSIPTESDVRSATARMTPSMYKVAETTNPVPPQLPPPAPVQKAVAAEEPSYRIRGWDGDVVYDVREVDGQWTCTCPAFAFGKTRPCKHVEQALAEEKRVEIVPEPEVARTPLTEPSATQVGRVFIPRFENAPVQQSALTLPARPPTVLEQDPWAVPSERKVPVGGKIVMGGGK